MSQKCYNRHKNIRQPILTIHEIFSVIGKKLYFMKECVSIKIMSVLAENSLCLSRKQFVFQQRNI